MEDYNQLIDNIRVKDCIQIQISSDFLHSNFQLIKQCLKKISTLKYEVAQGSKLNKEIYQRLNYIQKDIKQEKEKNEAVEKRVGVLEKKEFMDDVYIKLHQLQAKTDSQIKNKQKQGFQQIVKRLETINKFVTNKIFEEHKKNSQNTAGQITKVKQQLERYVQNTTFKTFKSDVKKEMDFTHKGLEQVTNAQKSITEKVQIIDEKTERTKQEIKQNSEMLKQINLGDIDSKLKKFKEQFQSNFQDLNKKLKRIITANELSNVQKSIVEKMDDYLLGLSQRIADKNQTKKALVFLENRLNILIDGHSPQIKQQGDPLFATKQWMCAACSTSLGKFQGKLGKFKPWAVFPCRQLSPQKSGGYGYLSYLDKITSNKGISLDDTHLERLNETTTNLKRESKFHSTKTTNFMQTYGDIGEDYPRLIGQYYRNPEEKQRPKTKGKQDEQVRNNIRSAVKTQRGFRVKKNDASEIKKSDVSEIKKNDLSEIKNL